MTTPELVPECDATSLKSCMACSDIPLRDVPPDGGRVQYLPRTHSAGQHSSLRVGRSGEPWRAEWGVDVVTPPMDAGTAVIYDYTTQHRGLKNNHSVEAGMDTGKTNIWRPVLKLDYFRRGVTTRDGKDGWCPENGWLSQHPIMHNYA